MTVSRVSVDRPPVLEAAEAAAVTLGALLTDGLGRTWGFGG